MDQPTAAADCRAMSGRAPVWRLVPALLLLGCGGEGGTSPSPTPAGEFAGTIFFLQFERPILNEDGTIQIGEDGTFHVGGPKLLASSDDGAMTAVDSSVFRHNSNAFFFSAAQDGRRGAFAILDGVATVDFSVRPFRYDTLFLGDFTERRPQIAPDGEHVLLWDDGPDDRVTVMRFDGSLPRILAQSQGGVRISRIGWAGPDRIVIVRVRITGGGDTTLTRFVHAEEHRISTGLVRDLGLTDSVIGLNTPDFFPSSVAFNSDGTRALWTNNISDVTPETRITRVTLADSNLRVLRTFEVSQDIGLPIFSPDSRRAVFSTLARVAACFPNCLLFLDLDSGQQALHTTPPEFGRLVPKAWTSRPLPPIAAP